MVLDDALIEQLAAEGLDELPLRQRQMAALENCLQKLPEARRRLVLAAYAPETSIKDLARQLGQTADGMYQMLRRIRHELLQCVDRTSRDVT